jgi:PST family polysaccharide transporter
MGSCSVALAVAGHGAWALAWGTVAGSLAYTASLWLMARDRPDLALWRTSREDLRGVLGFGVPAAGSSLLARLIFDIDYLIVGRLVGAVAVGYYTLAFRIPELLIVNVFFVLSGVTFPLYSRMKDDAVRLGRSYLFSVRLFSLYGVCAGVGLAVAAPVVVPVVFGEKWSDAVVPLVALALYAACRAVGVGANDVFKALGRPGLSVRLSLIRLVVLTPVLVAGAHWWGMVGVAWAQLGTSLLFTLLLQGVAIRVLGLTWRDLGSAVAPALLAGSAVAVAGFAVAQLPLVPVASLVAVVAAGTAAAAAVLLVGYPSLLREVRGRLRTPSAA